MPSVRMAPLLACLVFSAGCGSTPIPVDGPTPHACTGDAGLAAVEAAADGDDDAGEAAVTSDATGEVDAIDEGTDAFVAEAAGEVGTDAVAPLDASGDAPADARPVSSDAPVICDDNIKDGDETDIDCGGAICPPCSLGQRCLVPTDCGSWPGCDASKGGCACDATTHTCVVDHCADHEQDVDESAVDCGGGDCVGCAVGQTCVLHSDCASVACDLLTMTCAQSHCSDHVRDTSETDVDCGGGICSGCALGGMCENTWDCASNACDATTLVCIADQCADHRQDGQETGVDCGGPACQGCPLGDRCITTRDCATGLACNPGNPHLCE